jgi:hypothetical protein
MDAGPEATPDANFEGEDKKMTTSKNSNWQTSDWQHLISGGVTALEGSRQAQFIDYSIVEDSYELLPSGD